MEQLAKLLEELAKQLGTTAQYLWGVLIVQAKITAMVDSAEVVCIAIGIFLGYKTLRRWYQNIKNDDDDFDDHFGYQLTSVLGGIGAFFLIYFAIFGLIPEIITVIANPEYWALQEILSKLHN